MKKMTMTEQKQAMLGILSFLDRLCRENSINYSLMAGSLIGAVRHKGFIPWDDDIDVILTKDNYVKLKRLLEKEQGRYQMLKYDDGGKRFSFIKLIDTYTVIREGKQTKINPNYGVFVDVFCYYPTSDDDDKRKKHYRSIQLLVSLIGRRKLDFSNASMEVNLLRLGKNTISRLISYKGINALFDKTLNKYNDSTYVVSNWPAYGFKKEIQLKSDTEEYIDTEFEGLKVMIFKNYDGILTTTFGDYMKLPPKSERVSKHGVEAWWKKEGCE